MKKTIRKIHLQRGTVLTEKTRIGTDPRSSNRVVRGSTVCSFWGHSLPHTIFLNWGPLSLRKSHQQMVAQLGRQGARAPPWVPLWRVITGDDSSTGAALTKCPDLGAWTAGIYSRCSGDPKANTQRSAGLVCSASPFSGLLLPVSLRDLPSVCVCVQIPSFHKDISLWG